MGFFSFFKKDVNQGNYDDLTDQTKAKIQKVEALIREGGVLLKAGKLTQGLKIFQEVISIEPFQPFALNNVGWILIQLERCNEALPLIQKAISIEEQVNKDHFAFWNFYSNLGNCYLRMEKHNLALEAFLKAIKNAPKEGLSGLYHDAARCLFFLDRGDDAVNFVLKSLSYNLKDGDGFELLGQIYLYIKRFPLCSFACFFYAKYLGANLSNGTQDQLVNFQKNSPEIFGFYKKFISELNTMANNKEILMLFKQGPFADLNIIDQELSCFFMMIGSWISENSKHHPEIFREVESIELFNSVKLLNALK